MAEATSGCFSHLKDIRPEGVSLSLLARLEKGCVWFRDEDGMKSCESGGLTLIWYWRLGVALFSVAVTRDVVLVAKTFQPKPTSDVKDASELQRRFITFKRDKFTFRERIELCGCLGPDVPQRCSTWEKDSAVIECFASTAFSLWEDQDPRFRTDEKLIGNEWSL